MKSYQEAEGRIRSCKFKWRKREWWHVAKQRMMEDKGALPTEEEDLIGRCKALHDENLSRWLREDVEGKTEKIEKVSREGVEVNSIRICSGRSLCLNSCGERLEVISKPEVDDVGVSECSLLVGSI